MTGRTAHSTAVLLLVLLFSWAGQATAAGPEFTLAEALKHVGSTAEVTAAESALAEARRDLADALDPLDTSLGLSADTSFGGSSAGGQGDDGRLNAGLNFSATLNLPGVGPQAEAVTRAENSVTRAEGSLTAARNQAVSDTVQQYLEILRLDDELAIAGKKRELADLELEAFRTMQAAGAASELDELQAGISAATAGNDEASLTLQRNMALTEFSQFLDIALEPDTVFTQPEITGNPDALPAVDPERLRERDDVIEADLRTAEAALSVDAARRATRPVADVSVNYSTSGEYLSTRLGASVNTNSFQPTFSVNTSLASSGSRAAEGGGTVSVSLGVTVPLGAESRRSLESAELSAVDAALAAEQTLIRARNELRSRSDSLHSSETQLELTADLLRQAELSLERAEQRYAAGAIPAADLLRSEIAVDEARLQQARAEDNHLQALLELARTLAIDPLEVIE